MLLTILAEGAGAVGPLQDPTFWVAVGVLIVFAIMLWTKVPKIVGGMLDNKIAEIRKTLDEAAGLRKEAEALKAEYEAKTAGAQAEVEALMDSAEKEAALLVKQAEADTKNRRGRTFCHCRRARQGCYRSDPSSTGSDRGAS